MGREVGGWNPTDTLRSGFVRRDSAFEHATFDLVFQAMGELVDYLEARGYVERLPDPSDGRAKLVRLTERGWLAYRLAGRSVTELEATWAGSEADATRFFTAA